MPTYDYKCTACGHAFEHFQSMKDATLKTCPNCKKKTLLRLIGIGGGIIFKGSGFYTTDYRSESYKQAATADSSAAATPAASDAATPAATSANPANPPTPATPATSPATGTKAPAASAVPANQSATTAPAAKSSPVTTSSSADARVASKSAAKPSTNRSAPKRSKK